MTATASAEPRGTTVDPEDVARFSAMADEWWDPEGKFAPLHRFNPVRLAWLRERLCGRFDRDPRAMRPFEGLRFLDVGCGGGLISEPVARMGADVTGIDASERNVGTARAHAERTDVSVRYLATTAEELRAAGETFDAVLSLEVVEHVADVDLFLSSCCGMVREGGAMALATLNRTPKAFLMGIVGAEYVLRWLPRGTHRWSQFVRPSELARAVRNNGLDVAAMTGLAYDMLSGEWRLAKDVSVNYMMFATKGEGASRK
jgi:2-polyprenyl-6-hydroxyphenyl methylase/3-demethylubiquinone-9 3-methyltransferase